MFRLAVFSLFLVASTQGQLIKLTPKSCGPESIPFEMSVDLNGRPEINCDSPVCFGSVTDHTSGEEYDLHNMISKKRRFQRSINDRIAECAGKFTEDVCGANDEWTAGVMEHNNGTHIVLKMECCSFDGLNDATAMASVSLVPGQRYKGGVVVEDGQSVAFDLIKEVRKTVNNRNEPTYLVSIYRMACIPDPPEPKSRVSAGVERNIQEFGDRYASDVHRRDDVEEFDYPSRTYPNHRYRPAYRSRYGSEVRRRQSSYPPRRRQFYRPIYDEYDYYDLEPLPVVRRPFYKRFRSRFGDRPYAGGRGGGRPRAYGDNGAYEGSAGAPLQEYTDAPPPAVNYQDNEYRNPLPPTYTEPAYSHQPQQPQPAPLPIAPPPQIVQPPPHNLGGYALPNSYVQPLQQSSYIQQPPVHQYGSYPTSNTGGCAADPCSAYPQNSNPYPAPAYPAPSYGGGAPDLNSVFASLQCFSGDMVVQTYHGPKRMDELEVGDMVLSVDNSLVSYSPVIMFLHYKPDEEAVYRQLDTADGQHIKLTDFHLIYTSTCKKNENIKLVHAKDVKVGHCVHTIMQESTILKSSKVEKISQVKEKGIYAPLTASGDLMVNNILASCHSNVGVQTLQQTFFSLYRKISVFAGSLKSMIGLTPSAEKYAELPMGVEYMTTVMDILLPKSLFT